jgi:hypothetical protein
MTNETTSMSPTTSVWIEDGILYNQYLNEVTLENVLEHQQNSIQLLKEKGINLLPMIAIFVNVTKEGFKLTLANYAKILVKNDLTKFVACVWIVGASPEVQRIVNVFNKAFLSNRLRFAQTLEEAKTNAKTYLSSTKTILE